MSNKSEVRVDFTANAAVFHAVAHGVKEQISEIKSAMLGALGVGAIAEMVSSAVEFAKEADRAATELGVSLDRAIQLNRVMESIGKNSGDLVKSMGRFQQYMEKAYGDASKMSLLRQYGVNSEDFNNFDFDKILRKVLETSKTLPQAQNQFAFTQMFGRAMGIDLLYKRERLLETPEETGIKQAEVREIMELTARFKELKEAILILILRAIMPLGEWLLKKAAQDEDIAKGVRNRFGRALEISEKEGHPMSNARTKIIQGLLSADLFLSELLPDKSRKTSVMSVFEAQFGKEITKQVSKEFPWGSEHVDAYNKHKAGLQAELEAAEAARKAGNGVIPDIGKRPDFPTNPFLQIGGLMGIDTTYRLMDLQRAMVNAQEEANKILKEISAKLDREQGVKIAPPGSSPLPTFTPTLNGRPMGQSGNRSTSGRGRAAPAQAGRPFTVPGTSVTGIDFSQGR